MNTSSSKTPSAAMPEVPDSFRHLTVSSGIRASATRNPGKTALICGDEQRTYVQLVGNINRVANAMQGLGLEAGQNAAIIAPNCMDYIEVVAGVSDLGAAVVTPNPKLTPRELADICNDAQARVLFVHPDSESSIDASLFETVKHVIRLGPEYSALKARASDVFTPPLVAEWATFSIPYTSGTTGKPKGVMLPHRSRSLGWLAYACEFGIYSPDDHFLAIAPMCHGAGLSFAMCSVFTGGTAEIMVKFDPELVLRKLHKGDVTGIFTVPTHYHGMFGLEPKLLESLRGHRLNGITCNAAPLSQETKEQIVEYFGDGLLHELYGSTEAGIVTNLRPQDQLRKIKCVGLPFVGNQVRLLDDSGKEVGPNEVGELFSTSPYLFNGYWGKPEQSREAFRDGWVSVGDLAKRDDEGYIYIVDRKKDMVITGGMNVYPREIETMLDTHPAILESAIIGVPDARWGETLVAYVVFNQGQNASAEDLENFSKANMAPYKLPKSFKPIAQLPRNANGKVLKTELRAMYLKSPA